MPMGIWKKAKLLVETAEHLHFGGILLDLVFDWRVWLSGMGGSVVTLFTAAYDGRSVTDVLLAAVLGLAVFALLAAAVIFLWRVKTLSSSTLTADPESTARSPSSLMEDYQAGKWAPSYPPLRGEAPDWPIRELFGHIRPDYPLTASKTVGVATSDDLDNRWKPIGDYVIKQLSLGKLHAAGRKEVYNPIRHPES
jgi:hypothetical protein